MDYRIGLDIGIASVGFAVIETDKQGEPIRIEKLGVRIFDKAEQPKTGASLAEPRRTARGLRRIIRRRKHRVERTKWLLEKTFGNGIIDEIEKVNNNERVEDIIEGESDISVNRSIYALRYYGLDNQLSQIELGRILLYFVKHRGFLSNRKSENKNKDEGKLLTATTNNSNYLKEKGYRTIGEMIYLDSKYSYVEKSKNGYIKKVYITRNKQDEYNNTFLREDLLNELTMILRKQQEYGYINEDFVKKFINKDGIFYKNRNFDEGPGEPSKYRGGYRVGMCPFEIEEQRGPKSSYTVEYNNALQKLNNLKIKSNGEERLITEEEREKITEAIKEKEAITFTSLRKLLGLNVDKCLFNLINYSNKKTVDEVEKATFVSMKKSYEIRKKLSEENRKNVGILDKIAYILSMYKADENRSDNLSKIEGLTEQEIENLLSINCKEFAGVSIKFLRKIQPYLEQGKKYNEACSLAGYDHRLHNQNEKLVKLNTKEIHDEISEITSPVVKRSISQTVKVLNAIIDKYGSPIAINIELAREMSKGFSERQKILKENEESKKYNEQIKQRIKDEFKVISPNGQDILKYFLYEEQSGKCAYSLQPLDFNRLFEPNYVQIDHIVPYSKSFDDSMNNKVLVLTKENQNKKNRLPYEYFGDDEKRWSEFEAYVNGQKGLNRKKVDLLLKKKFTTEDEKEWKERNLNDTKYITRYVYNLINDNLEFAQSKLNKKVVAVNGRITSYARKMWGLTKSREEGDKHHALDAAVIACISEGTIQKITAFNKGKELLLRYGDSFVDEDGVCLSEDEYDKSFGKHLKAPYEWFAKELELRLDNNPKIDSQFFVKIGYTEEEIERLAPVFVSRMVNKKMKGQIHDQTIRSAKIFEETGEVVSKTPLTKLHLTKDGLDIEGYYRKQDDRLLYEKLLTMLQQAEGKAEVAFKETVYKPRSDGKNGAVVKKVKITEKQTDGKLLENINGIASNGGMARIDIFVKDKKYYAVPVYIKDFYAKTLPNKASTQGKSYKDWREIDESYEFLFSLHKNDLVYFRHKNGIELTKTNSENKDDKIIMKEGFLYYNSLDISRASIKLLTHDNSYDTRSGIQNLEKLQKCNVDILGNIHLIDKEKRETFSNFRRGK